MEVTQRTLDKWLATSLAEPALEHLEADNRPQLKRLLREKRAIRSLALFLAKRIEGAHLYGMTLQENPDIDPITLEEMVLNHLIESIGSDDKPVLLDREEKKSLTLFKLRYNLT